MKWKGLAHTSLDRAYERKRLREERRRRNEREEEQLAPLSDEQGAAATISPQQPSQKLSGKQRDAKPSLR